LIKRCTGISNGRVTRSIKCIGISQYSHIKNSHAKATRLARGTVARNEEQGIGSTQRVGKNKG
jgi:hypothetical protein